MGFFQRTDDEAHHHEAGTFALETPVLEDKDDALPFLQRTVQRHRRLVLAVGVGLAIVACVGIVLGTKTGVSHSSTNSSEDPSSSLSLTLSPSPLPADSETSVTSTGGTTTESIVVPDTNATTAAPGNFSLASNATNSTMGNDVLDVTTEEATVAPTTTVAIEATTTAAPTETPQPTTSEPTEAPTTIAPTTRPPTTEAPTTTAPPTPAPTTKAPTTQPPPVTQTPSPPPPTTTAPVTTQAPVTAAPTTQPPATQAPTTTALKADNDNGFGLWGGAIKIVNNLPKSCIYTDKTATYFTADGGRGDLTTGQSVTLGPFGGSYTLGVQENVFAKCAYAGTCAWDNKSADNYCYNFSLDKTCGVKWNDCPWPAGNPSPAPDGRKRYSIAGSIQNGVCVLSVNPIGSGACSGGSDCFCDATL
ncbi:hypothetical protein AeNC1_004655 [Aphanomyces euteiches]|nr:hypothetical protein AeNC1_004655 [Aphanomyces euteiches]